MKPKSLLSKKEIVARATKKVKSVSNFKSLYDVAKEKASKSLKYRNINMCSDSNIISFLKTKVAEKFEVGDAIVVLKKALKEDKEYRETWIANIAMSFVDNKAWYRKRSGKKVLSNEDFHKVANLSAEHFLNLLCGEIKYPKGR